MKDNTQMNYPTLPQVLEALCKRAGWVKEKDGSVNHNEVARELNVKQPTVTRLLAGQSRDPKEDTLKPYTDYFRITVSQLKGRAKIEGLFEDDEYDYPETVSPNTQSLAADLAEYDALSRPLRDDQIMGWLNEVFPKLSDEERLAFAQEVLERAVRGDK